MKKQYQYMLMACMLSVLFTGCAGFEHSAGTCGNCTAASVSTRKDAETIETLRYFSRIRGLQSEELSREHAAAILVLTKQKTATNRIKLAFLLCLPNANFRDDARASALLAEVLDDKKENVSLGNLAALLIYQISEQKRQDERYQKANQSLKDEQKRADQLEQKLDALKNIEKSIIQRESKTVPVK